MFRRLGSSLASHRASITAEFGSLWDFILDRDRSTARSRRRSAPEDARSPHRLARDLLQVVQETVFAKKFDERRCPLVKEESDLSSDEGNDRIANLIDFFFTIVKSQKDDRKSSSSSCFKTESPNEYKPKIVNIELEKKMETLMEFLATTGCVNDPKDDKKITLMEFLFGPENTPLIEVNDRKEMTLSESNINVKLSYIDETPIEESSNLVDMLLKYMENYDKEDKPYRIYLSPSEKSKSDVTISKLETFDDISKTKSDSTLTHTQDTVIEREIDIKSIKSDKSSRRISETMVDLSNVKHDLEEIFAEAVMKVYELGDLQFEEQNDTMSEAEDLQNFDAYTKPPLLYNVCMPYSVELSDIIEEDESLDPSSKLQEDKMCLIRECAETLLDEIEDKVQRHFEDSDDEFDITSSMKRSSISLFDLRLIPDLPPSMIIKPKVKRIDKSTSTTEISDSISDISRRVDSCNMTEDTSLSSSERQAERALDKLESLHKFFSRSRLDIIKETNEEEKNERIKRRRSIIGSETKSSELKPGQASLDDVEELQDEVLLYDIDKIKEDILVEENEMCSDVNDDTTEGINNIEDEIYQDVKDRTNGAGISPDIEDTEFDDTKDVTDDVKNVHQYYGNLELREEKEADIYQDNINRTELTIEYDNDSEKGTIEVHETEFVRNKDEIYQDANITNVGTTQGIGETQFVDVQDGINSIKATFPKHKKSKHYKMKENLDSHTRDSTDCAKATAQDIEKSELGTRTDGIDQTYSIKKKEEKGPCKEIEKNDPLDKFYDQIDAKTDSYVNKDLELNNTSQLYNNLIDFKSNKIANTKDTESLVNPKVNSIVEKSNTSCYVEQDYILGDSDYSEIDKIISEAVKIILFNELEYHNAGKKHKDNK